MIALLAPVAAIAFWLGLWAGYNQGRKSECRVCDTLQRLLDAEDCVKALDETLRIAHEKKFDALLHRSKN